MTQSFQLSRIAPRTLAIAIAACAAILGFTISAHATHAATCTFTGAVSSDFNTNGNWNCGFTPGATSTAIIPTATSTSLSAPVTIVGLQIGTSSTLTTGSNNLTISDSVTSTGSLVDGSGTITVGNDWDFRGGGTFTPGTGTVIFSTPSIIDLSAILTDTPMSFNNLTVSSTQFVRPSSAVLYTVGGALTITQGTLHLVNGADMTVTGAMTTAAAGVFAMQDSTSVFTANGTSTNNGTFGHLNSGLLTFNNDFINNGTVLGTAPSDSESLTFKKAFTNSGTFNAASSTVTFSGTGAQTIPSATYWNLTISQLSGTGSATLGGNITVNNSFSSDITGVGPFSYAGFQLEALGDVNFITAGGVNGTLLIDGAGAQTITNGRALNTIINKASGTATCITDCESLGSLTLQSGTYNGGSAITEVGQTGGTPFLITGGIFQPGTGTFQYFGNVQTIATTTFNNLLIQGGGAHENMNGSTTVLGTFSIPLSNDSLAIGSSGILTVNGLITNGGLITESAGGKIIHAAEAVTFSDSAGTPVSSYTSPSSVYFKVSDGNRNLSGTTTESFPLTISLNPAAGSDTETVTLTETSASSGVFLSNAIPLVSSSVASPGNSQFEVVAAGSANGTYTDNQDPSDVVTGTASVTPASSGGGGGGGGGGSSGGGGGGGLGSSGSNALAPLTTQYQSYLANLQSIGVPVHALVKLPDDGNVNTQEDSAVYYIGTDGMRHAFPNSKVYFTWYQDFSGVQLVNSTQLASIPLGKNVTYKPGVKMVKFTTDPKVYAVEKGGNLRWVTTEAVATSLYGTSWNTMIDDISDAFYSNYQFGTSINSTSDYSPSAAQASVQFPSDSLGM